jgi:parallel beta-helix repeat protein
MHRSHGPGTACPAKLQAGASERWARNGSTMNRMYRRCGLVAGAAVLSALALAGSAAAHHATASPPADPVTGCGQVVTGNLNLTHDVGPCAPSASGAALTIDSSGTSSTAMVTLNLKGHKVHGCANANPTGPCNGPGVNVNDPSLQAAFVTGEGPGIVIGATKNWVKITDSSKAKTGTVSDFDTGIVIRGGSNNVVEKVNVLRNVGSAATNSDYGEGIGIYTSGSTGSTNNTIRANNVEGNGPYAGIALYNFDDLTGAPASPCATKDNTVGGPAPADGNTVKDNYVDPKGTTYQDDGIRVEPHVCNSVVQNNTVTGSSLDGIAVFATATGTQVKDNIVQGNGSQPLPTQRKGDGIVVFQTANGSTDNPCTISGNTVGGSNGATDTTVPASPPPSSTQGNAGNGIRVDAHTCTVDGNTTAGNGYNVLVNGTATPDPRGATDLTVSPSQYAYYDLKDGQRDRACGSIATNGPTGGTRNYWGNTTLNTYASRNREPTVPQGTPPALTSVTPPSFCIE